VATVARAGDVKAPRSAQDPVSGPISAHGVVLKDGRNAELRLARPDDARAITAFVNLVGGERRYVLRERATWTLGEERETLRSANGKRSAFFVAVVDGRLSGLLNIHRGPWPKNEHVTEFGMACLPTCRRVGLGTALVHRALDWSGSVGARKVTLEVFSSNQAAIALYRKLGFEEEGRRRRQYLVEGELVDGIWMARWL
jgi:RimJ/RimL family protein N-acetyltransferase